ncbi:MAG: nuclear transport factor 2 family protein [Rubrivivax sp.]
MSVTRNYSLENLAARAEIQDRIHAWTRGVDRRDWTLAASAFHPDGWDDHGLWKGDIPGLVRTMEPRHAMIPKASHQVSNIVIEFVDETTAVVESYLFVWLGHDPEDQVHRSAIAEGPGDSMLMSARYVDLFKHRDGAWRIQKRTTAFEASMHFDADKTMKPVFTRGTREPDDVLHTLRHEMGLA